MANSYVEYTAAGGTAGPYSVPFLYLKKAHVVVTKDGVVVSDYTWTSASQITFNANVTAGVKIKFARNTPETPLFNSADGNVLTDTQLKVLGRQAIYLAEETNDASNDTLAEAEAAIAAAEAAVTSTADDVVAAAASASAADSSADDAAASALAAAGSASAAAAAFDSFDDRYLGAKSSNPTLDNDGNALVTGALYYNTSLGVMRQWDGASWVDIAAGLSQSAGDLRYLQLSGGTLTGALTLPNSDPSGSNDATRKAYVDAIRDLLFSTGDAKITLKTTADVGWVMADDGTIGSASSGATTRANADTAALYALIWNGVSNTYAPVSGGRGANAAADFAANKTIALPKVLGRALAVAGAGATLTSRALGETVGAETHTLTAAEQADMPVTGSTTNAAAVFFPSGASVGGLAGGATFYNAVLDISGTADGGGGAHNNMQPSSFWNFMVKL